MEYRVLGPVEVWDAGVRLPLAAAKQQALLALGVLNAGRVVSVESIVDALWEAPPATAGALVQSYVSALRRVLHRDDEVIVTRPPGYLFRIGPEATDLHRFEALLAKGRAAAADGRHQDAADDLRAALELWRGHAFDGLASLALQARAVRLEEARIAAQEERIAAELELCREVELVPELVGLVSDHPLRERLRGQLMLALYRLGRQADALAVYRDGAEVLADELGLDPGAELRALQEAILRNDAALDPPAAQRRPARAITTTAAVPAQLPAAIADLTGRDAEATRVRDAIESGSAAVYAISGKAGGGKSALAIWIAHAARAAFPDGQLYASLRGTDAPADPGDVLGGFLRALGVDSAEVPDDLDQRAAQYRTMIADRRVLIVLDDAASAKQVRPLLPSRAGSAVLVTSRASLYDLEGAAQLTLDVLDPTSAVRLLGEVAGRERVDAEPEAAREIARLCGHLPLALRTAAARLAARRNWKLSVLAARLRDERRRLDELAVGDLEVRASLELSYRGLSPLQQRAFRLLGVVTVADFAPWVLAPVLDVPVATAERLIEQLADAQLLDFAGPDDGDDRYRMHDLIRVYARERCATEEPEADQRAAIARLLDSWLGLLDRAVAGRPSGLAAQRRSGRPVGDVAPAALDADPAGWLAGERSSLVAIVERAADLGLDEGACDLAAVLSASSFRLDNAFDEWWRTHDVALAAARRAGNRHGEATLLVGLGQLRYEQDRFGEANAYFHEALLASRDAGDEALEAAALGGLGEVCREQGHFAEACSYLERARAAFTRLGDEPGVATTAYGLGVVHRETGDFAEALAAFNEALAIHRASGALRGQGLCLRAIGLVHRASGELSFAAELFEQALEALRRVGDELAVAYGVQALAKVHIRQGLGDQARGPLLECLEVCRRLQDRFGEALMLRTLGELELAARSPDPARARLTAALALWEELGQPTFRGRTLRDLADLHELCGDAAAASATRAEALDIFRALGSREHTELTELVTER